MMIIHLTIKIKIATESTTRIKYKINVNIKVVSAQFNPLKLLKTKTWGILLNITGQAKINPEDYSIKCVGSQ